MHFKINAFYKSIRVYGQCEYPRRLHGVFEGRVGGAIFPQLLISEGHVLSSIRRRLLSISCQSHAWHLDQLLRSSSPEMQSPRLMLYGEGVETEFAIEQIEVQVCAHTDQQYDGAEITRGRIECDGEAIATVDVREIVGGSGRQFVLSSATDLRMAAEKLEGRSNCSLVTE